MGVKEALVALFSKPVETSESGPKLDRTLYYNTPWVRFYQRKALWNDLEIMDHDEPIVARGLDFISRFSTQFVEGGPTVGFEVEGPDNELAVIGPLVRRLQLQAYDDTRSMVKFGDMFGEVVVDETMNVVNLKQFPYAYQIEKNTDVFGSLLAGDPNIAMEKQLRGFSAYDQVSDHGQMVAAFWPYQIAHFSFGTKQGLQYTEPYLGCTVSITKRLRAMEDGLAIARLTRAYPRTVHMIPIALGTSPDEVKKLIKKYIEGMGTDTTIPYDQSAAEFKVSSKESPPAVDTAYYLPRFYDPDGKTVDGEVINLEADNPNLANLEDVYLLLRRLLCAIGVPADFLNLSVGQKSFIDKTSPEKREAFLYLCCAVQYSYIMNIRAVLDIQLLLNGFVPGTTKYEIIPPRISPREAEVSTNIDLKRANTAAIWSSLGIPKVLTGGKILKMTPKEVAVWVASEGTEAPDGGDPDEAAEEMVRFAREQFSNPYPRVDPNGVVTMRPGEVMAP